MTEPLTLSISSNSQWLLHHYSFQNNDIDNIDSNDRDNIRNIFIIKSENNVNIMNIEELKTVFQMMLKL